MVRRRRGRWKCCSRNVGGGVLKPEQVIRSVPAESSGQGA